MILKRGVRVGGLRPELLLAIVVANDVYTNYGKELVITSVVDGKHKVGSTHYSGCGVDLRTRYFKEDDKKEVADEIRKNLTDDYFVLLESDHIHLHYKPRRR